ncbi:MAG: esterase [Chlorobiales bacterium]|nr:esterase [Chlorobiales bacterium]
MKIFFMWIIEKAFWTAVLGISLSQFIPARSLGADLTFRKMQVGGIERTYYLHLPPVYGESARKLPVLLVLHGGGRGDGDEVARWTGFLEIADREGFIAVYPNGIDARWNDGRIGSSRNGNENAVVDDVGFISVLIDHIVQNFRGDPGRVYVTGLSNGGMMTFRLGCEISEKLAAIAPVIANMPENIYGECRPGKKLPVLVMNGTSDPLVPWEGGAVGYFGERRGRVVSTNRTVEFWRAHNRCSSRSVRWLPDRDRRDNSRVRMSVWGNSDNTCEVVLYRIEGGGHTFPGSDIPNRPLLLGRKNNDIEGPEVIWSFFRKYSM